jgi:uncharacterized membrane protein YcaP (DUF421 family)
MDTIFRVLAMYIFLLLIFRIAGHRTLGEATTFDFILLLIISETTQQAMVGNDPSLTNAFLLIITWVGIDISFSVWKQRFKRLDQWMEGLPLVIVEEGRLLKDRMEKSRIDEEDILSSARQSHGLERMEQIKYAVLERSGGISIIPREKAG